MKSVYDQLFVPFNNELYNELWKLFGNHKLHYQLRDYLYFQINDQLWELFNDQLRQQIWNQLK